MAYSHGDALKMLAEIEHLEKTIAAKRHTLRVAISQLGDLAEERETDHGYLCPECGLRFHDPQRVTEHRENVHGIRVG